MAYPAPPAASNASAPPELADLERMFQKAAKARRPLDAEWLVDCAFYAGRQYTRFNTTTGSLEQIPADKRRPNQPRPVANKIYSFIMDSWADAKQLSAEVEVMPRSSDSFDISDAKVAEAFLDMMSLPTYAAYTARRDQALFFTVLCGEGWLKWTWNAAKKRPDVEFCSPLEVYAQPTAGSYLDARWIIHSRGMDPEDVYELYGVEVIADAVDKTDQLGQSVQREIGLSTGLPTVTVKELWELPSRRYPKGRYCVWAGVQWLSQKADGTYGVLDYPYAHDELPFTQIGHSPVPGTLHYTSGTRVARPLQMELNQFHAQKITSRKKFTNFKWLIDSQTADSMEELPNDDIDQTLIGDFRNGSMLPSIVQPAAWPDSQDGEWLQEAMDDAIGQHAVSQGQAPGRVDSAQGLQTLEENDLDRLSEIKGTLITSTARGFGQWLQLAAQFMSAEQVIPYYSPNGIPAVHHWLASESATAKAPLLRVVVGGGLPKNRAARRAELISLATALGPGAMPPRKLLQMLDYPVDMELTGDEQDWMEAEMENLLMQQGISVTPKPWQNHDIHRQSHNNWRKTAAFGSASEDVWSKAEFHMEATDAQELVEIQQEAERQAHIQQVTQQAAASIAPPEGSPAEEAGEPPAEAAAEGDAAQPSPAAPPAAPAPAPTTPQP